MDKDKVIKNLKFKLKVFVVLCIVMAVGYGVFGWYAERTVFVSVANAKFDVLGADDFCLLISDSVTDEEGYCFTNDFDGKFVHYFDCSWSKLKVNSDDDISLGDKYYFWYTNCEFVKTRVI